MFAPETAPKPGRWRRSVTCSRSPRLSWRACGLALLRRRETAAIVQDLYHKKGKSFFLIYDMYGAVRQIGANFAHWRVATLAPFPQYRPPSEPSLVASALTPGARFLTTNALVGAKRPKGRILYQIIHQYQSYEGYIQQTTSRLDLPVSGETQDCSWK